MSPFSELLRVATATRTPRRTAPSVSILSGNTHTSALLHLLECNGPMTTRELADATILHTRAVWGLLRVPKNFGQVKFADGLWELDREFAGNDVLRAAALLRAKGWRLEAPR